MEDQLHENVKINVLDIADHEKIDHVLKAFKHLHQPSLEGYCYAVGNSSYWILLVVVTIDCWCYWLLFGVVG